MAKPEDMSYRPDDFPGGKLPADMSLDELLDAMREIMAQAMTHAFNPDIAFFVWDALDNQMCEQSDAPREWYPPFGSY